MAPLISGHSHLAIGTRLVRGSRVMRGAKREVISRCYNLILRGALAARFSDAECGFKAIRGDVAAELLPLIEDTGWFFDTELLVLAQRSGLRVHEVPVDWVDDPDSRVDVVATAMADLRGVARLLRGSLSGSIPVGRVRDRFAERDTGFAQQLWRFATIGVASTLAYAVAFVVRLGFVAEAADHHPDILISHKRVTLIYTTHSAGGLTDKDFDAASEAGRIARAMAPPDERQG